MKAQQLQTLLQGGKIFSVEFIKKNGETRVLNGRTGVHKGLSGDGMKYNPIERNLLPVYDVRKRAYRMINVDTIKRINAEGHEYIINRKLIEQ